MPFTKTILILRIPDEAKVIASFVLLLIACGCRRGFDGDINFVNRSGRELEWVTVTGFEREPPIGILINGTHKGAHMSPMPVPTSVTITWRVAGGSDQRSIVSLTGVPPNTRNGELRFVFNSSNQWVFTLEPQL